MTKHKYAATTSYGEPAKKSRLEPVKSSSAYPGKRKRKYTATTSYGEPIRKSRLETVKPAPAYPGKSKERKSYKKVKISAAYQPARRSRLETGKPAPAYIRKDITKRKDELAKRKKELNIERQKIEREEILLEIIDPINRKFANKAMKEIIENSLGARNILTFEYDPIEDYVDIHS